METREMNSEMVKSFTEWFKHNKEQIQEARASAGGGSSSSSAPFGISDFETVMSLIAKWTAPCTFHRTKRAPIDDKSVFSTYYAMTQYISDEQTTSYPGQIVSVIDPTDLTKKGVYVLQIVNGTLTPVKIGEGGSSSSTTSSTNGTCGVDCCVWINNPTTVAANFHEDQKDNPNYWVASDSYYGKPSADKIPDGTTYYVFTDQLGKTVDLYRLYTPAHTEDASGNWVDGHWSDWTVLSITDGRVNNWSIDIYKVEIDENNQRYVFTTTDGEVLYSNDQQLSLSNKNDVVMKLSNDTNSAIAVREWIND